MKAHSKASGSRDDQRNEPATRNAETADEVPRINEERMRAMKEAYQSVVNGEKAEDSLKPLSQLVVNETRGDARTAFYVADDNGACLHPVFGAGTMDVDYLTEIDNSPTGEDPPACGLHIPTGKPVILYDVLSESPSKSLTSLARKYQYRSCWSFPIITRGNKTVGAFAMYFKSPRKATGQDLLLVEIVTSTAAVIISNYSGNLSREKSAATLQQSEQRFRSLVESYAQAVWEAEANGEIVKDSPSWRTYTGQTYDEWIGRGWLNAVHPDDRVHAEKQWGKAISNKRHLDTELRLKHAGNGYRWTNARATPVVDEKGTVLKWAGMIIDIHARKEAEQGLKELNTRLQEIDKAKTNFFNNVSHEFRTPLTLLLGPLEEVLKSGKSKLSPDDAQKLEFSFRNAMRLQKMVNTLLDFARIEAGKLEAFYQPTDFCKLTIDLASNFRSAIENAGLKYIVKSEVINEPVYLNREMWEKIVFNLLSNAFRFTQRGKIEVIIRNKKKNVELRIKDSGVGIAAKNHRRVFERFTRIEGTHARAFEGTGIGLALTRELVLANGGNIKLKSEEKIGSEFIVSIPKGKDHLPRQQIYETWENLSGDLPAGPFVEEISGWRPEDEKLVQHKLKKYRDGNGLRVLIAEDNADMREYLTSVLSGDKYEVHALEDGQKVLNFLRKGGAADLILADVMMPGVDGYELVQWLKGDPKFSDIPIILLSGRSTEEAKIEGLRMGADDYLVKPFSAKELRARVMARIAARRSRTNDNRRP